MAQAIVQRACGDLRSAIGDEALVRLNFTADLRDMLEALEAIQPVLEAADIMLFRVPFVFEWQQSVWDAAYKIMDMADELQDTRSLPTAQMARMLPCHSITKYAMAIKVDETKKQVMEIRRLCPRFISLEADDISGQIIEERKTGPVFEEAMVFHRGSDKERIMDVLLLSANRNNTQELITIIPIFGLAGSGKTTLAQMVFSDTHSLQGYDFRVWVHVSPELDFQTIGESIIHWVSGTGGGQEEVNDDHGSISHVEGMEHIMKRLHQLLNGKKVLLVLDDLWEEDPIQLQLLKSMLTFLGGKVDVIVTTCNQAIARNICTVEPYRLNSLSDDTCWEIIKKSIHFEDKKELEKIGREMASKCCGVPSAAQAFEIMLYSGDAQGWKEVLNIDIWGHLCGFDTKSSLLLSTLELSYMSMPPDLRLCFASCVIFPNGHKFVKDDLIHQWIALHLIEPSEILSATHTAEEYLTRLLDMSFLQTSNSDPAGGKDDKGAILFTMHDLAHDFARRFPQCFWYGLATNHHGKLDDTYAGVTRALRCVGCSKVEFNDDSFSRMKYLRVLELKGSSIKKLPDSIWQLRHLGYLKISDFSGLVTLPKSLGHLINLLHIDLSGCSGLLNLPESFGKLTRLVHANLSGCSRLANLPESFGDLINLSHVNLSRCHGLAELPEPLRKLDKLVYLDLSFCSCFEGIGKVLGGLTNLEHLNLSNTSCYLAQHRFHPQDLKVAVGKLTKLRYLNLSMCLNTIFYYYRTQESSLQYILDCLRGLSSLEHLDLSHNTFLFDLPGSLGDLSMLHILNLSGCIRLKRVGEIKSLKFIYLRNCRALESCSFVVRVDDDDTYRSSNIDQLEHVNCQELQISCLEKVRYIEEAQGIKLVEKKKLEKLKLSWTFKLVPPPNLQCQQLQISCLENVRSSEEAQRIKLAEKLKLEKLKPSWTVEYSPRSVEDSVLLGGLVPPPNLQCLELNGYTGMCLPGYLSDLTSLRELKIVCCEQLNYLPDSIQKLTNLKDLCISHCPELEKWCQLEENKKMLVHIPNKKYGVMSKRPNLSKEASLETVGSKQSTCNGEQPGVARWT